MFPPNPRSSPAACPALLSGVLAVLALSLLPTPAHAAVVKPWTPAGADSITSLVAEAKVRFRQADTDTITEQSIIPFERVGQAARRMLRHLGRENMLYASGIAASLDSLGLDVDVVNDAEMPSVVLVLVRNPYRRSMQCIGYLLWYRGVDLRMQGASFPAAIQPRLRTWWTGHATGPYATAVIYHERGNSGRLGFKYLRLSGDAFYWDLVQYEGNGPDLGANGDATFADLNHDGSPELVAFSASPPDSILSVEPPVQPVRREAIYTDSGIGFEVLDARIVPGPLATLRLFVSALREGNRDQARRLLVNPVFLDMAQAAGWAQGHSPSSFVVDRQDENRTWPTWLGARVRGVTGVRRWVFHFTLKDGLWLIKDWIAEESPQAAAARAAARDSTGGHQP